MLGTSLVRRSSDPFVDFVDHFFDRSLFGRPTLESTGDRSWVPSVDLSQDDDNFQVVVDLPGLKKSDINLTVENDTLTISGERQFENVDNKRNFSRVERTYGRFSRSFSLPTNIDAEKVAASFEDGVLTVTIPKLEQAKTRTIAIK